MFPDLITMTAKEWHDDWLREAERDRLANVARQTATAYGDRRKGLRRLFGTTGRLNPVEAAPPRRLIREPAV
jgi:hypothetical protein